MAARLQKHLKRLAKADQTAKEARELELVAGKRRLEELVRERVDQMLAQVSALSSALQHITADRPQGIRCERAGRVGRRKEGLSSAVCTDELE